MGGGVGGGGVAQAVSSSASTAGISAGSGQLGLCMVGNLLHRIGAALVLGAGLLHGACGGGLCIGQGSGVGGAIGLQLGAGLPAAHHPGAGSACDQARGQRSHGQLDRECPALPHMVQGMTHCTPRRQSSRSAARRLVRPGSVTMAPATRALSQRSSWSQASA